MRETLPPLTSLYAFVLVAETGGLAAAADRLNVTQPAVSKRIRDLEALYGIDLIERGPNAIRLTPAGRTLAHELAPSFAAIRAASAALFASPTRPLHVRAHSTWALRWLIPRLPDFRARHPGREVEVSTAVSFAAFKRDPGDVAVHISDAPPSADAVGLQSVSIKPFATPALARAFRLRKGDGFPGLTLLGSKATPGHWALWADATGVSLSAQPVLFESTALAVEAALQGMGAVIVAPILIAEDLRKRRLASLCNEEVVTDHRYWLVFPPGRPRQAAIEFKAWLLAKIAEDETSARPGRPRVR